MPLEVPVGGASESAPVLGTGERAGDLFHVATIFVWWVDNNGMLA